MGANFRQPPNAGAEAVIVSKSITANGTYNASSDNADGYNPVTVNVPESTIVSKSITANGTYNASSDNADGYNPVTVNVPESTIVSKSITANGTYNASSDSADGYNPVTVNVPTGGTTTELWSNQSPSASFDEQDIVLSSAIENYDYIKVVYKYYSTSEDSFEAIFPATTPVSGRYCGALPGIIQSARYSCRFFYYSGTTLHFGLGKNTYNNSTQNNYSVPVAVYGIKY